MHIFKFWIYFYKWQDHCLFPVVSPNLKAYVDLMLCIYGANASLFFLILSFLDNITPFKNGNCENMF